MDNIEDLLKDKNEIRYFDISLTRSASDSPVLKVFNIFYYNENKQFVRSIQCYMKNDCGDEKAYKVCLSMDDKVLRLYADENQAKEEFIKMRMLGKSKSLVLCFRITKAYKCLSAGN